MRKVLLDTNAYTYLVAGNTDTLSEISLAQIVFISPTVLGELYIGFKGGSKMQENADILHRFLQKPTVKVFSISSETAEIYGNIKHNLKKSGTPIPTNDIWIAAQAIETGSVLITFDKHFTKIPGLRMWDF